MTATPIFLSVPKPFLTQQEAFVVEVERQLKYLGLEPQTLGRSNYDMQAPLEGIRRLMVGSCGLLALAFRRTRIDRGAERPSSDMGQTETRLDNVWLTSSYCQIEPAMAFQLGLPILVWREDGVIADGVLDRGALGLAMPEFSLAKTPPDLNDPKWRDPFRQWTERVASVYRNRGNPPKLY